MIKNGLFPWENQITFVKSRIAHLSSFKELHFRLTLREIRRYSIFKQKNHSNQRQLTPIAKRNVLRLINISLRILKFSDASLFRRGLITYDDIPSYTKARGGIMASKHGRDLELERHEENGNHVHNGVHQLEEQSICHSCCIADKALPPCKTTAIVPQL
jgi:hypothetical protein